MYNDFKADIETSDKVEVNVIKKLQNVNPEFIFNGFSGTKGYDATFTIDDKVYTLEIKSDWNTRDTGNMVVEYECRGKESGIATSTAHFWAIAVMYNIDTFDLYLINTKILQRLIKEGVYFDTMVGGDPGSRTKLYRFKLEEFKKHCKVVPK